MRRVTLSRTGHWIAGLNGAAIASILIGALAQPQDGGYLGALYQQIANVPAFDFGTSAISGAPALAIVLVASLQSAQIVLPAAAIAILLGPLIGAALLWRKINFLSIPIFNAAASVPVFCTALIAMAFLVAAPNADGANQTVNVPNLGYYLDAPLVWVVALTIAGAIASTIQWAAKIALRESYVGNMARFSLRRAEVVRAYALRHILALTLIRAGDILLAVYGAVVVAEWVFHWPGAGSLFVRSVALQDWHVVALLVLLLAGARFTAEYLGAVAARTLLGTELAP